jgi:hypothetical protein
MHTCVDACVHSLGSCMLDRCYVRADAWHVCFETCASASARAPSLGSCMLDHCACRWCVCYESRTYATPHAPRLESGCLITATYMVCFLHARVPMRVHVRQADSFACLVHLISRARTCVVSVSITHADICDALSFGSISLDIFMRKGVVYRLADDLPAFPAPSSQ